MTKKKYVALTSLLLSLSIASLITLVGSQPLIPYDPWYDLNDDGEINILDMKLVKLAYGGSGVAFNKTEALLNLTERVDDLETGVMISSAQARNTSSHNSSFAMQSVNTTEIIFNHTVANTGQKIEYLTDFVFIYDSNGTLLLTQSMAAYSKWIFPSQNVTFTNIHIQLPDTLEGFIVERWTYDGDRALAHVALS